MLPTAAAGGRRFLVVPLRMLAALADCQTVRVFSLSGERSIIRVTMPAAVVSSATIRNRPWTRYATGWPRHGSALRPDVQRRVWTFGSSAHVLDSDDALRARCTEFDQVIATGPSQDLGQPDDPLVPRLAATTAVADSERYMGHRGTCTRRTAIHRRHSAPVGVAHGFSIRASPPVRARMWCVRHALLS